ncbi:MAG: hypothetical protein QM751_06485 [Paludibacteraceae bacterium]
MKFGKVENPSKIDFSIPADAEDTKRILSNSSKKEFMIIRKATSYKFWI